MLPKQGIMVLFDWDAIAGQSARRLGWSWGRNWGRNWGWNWGWNWVKSHIQPLARAYRREVLAIALWLICITGLPAPAQASIHSYPEPERQTTMYRSRLSLRDDQDLAWQTILFKRVKAGQVTELNLRLISFPGQLTLSYPQALWVEQGRYQTWELPDETLLDPQLQTVQNSLAQYDAKPLLLTLDRLAPLTLTVTLAEQKQRRLLVPPYVIKEWLQLQDMPLD